MERDDDTVKEQTGHDHAAAPEQVKEGYATGLDQKPDSPEELLEPNFARGIADEDLPGTEHRGRFSEGAEELPDSPEKEVQGRYSRGIERSPTSE